MRSRAVVEIPASLPRVSVALAGRFTSSRLPAGRRSMQRPHRPAAGEGRSPGLLEQAERPRLLVREPTPVGWVVTGRLTGARAERLPAHRAAQTPGVLAGRSCSTAA